MNSVQYLSYSGFKTYEECPKKYEYKYIKKQDVKASTKGSFLGRSIGRSFEWFYSRRLWSTRDPKMSMLNTIDESIEKSLIESRDIDQEKDYKFISDIRKSMEQYIPPAVDNIKKYKFLSVYSMAEHDLTVTKSCGDITMKLGGRADFIHSNDKKSYTIVDGKASMHRGQYTDKDQLIMYSMLFYLKYHIVPKNSFFLYYAFPHNPVDEYTFGVSDIKTMMDRVIKTGKRIKLSVFGSTPSQSSCKLCEYKDVCQDASVAKKSVEFVDITDI